MVPNNSWVTPPQMPALLLWHSVPCREFGLQCPSSSWWHQQHGQRELVVGTSQAYTHLLGPRMLPKCNESCYLESDNSQALGKMPCGLDQVESRSPDLWRTTHCRPRFPPIDSCCLVGSSIDTCLQMLSALLNCYRSSCPRIYCSWHHADLCIFNPSSLAFDTRSRTTATVHWFSFMCGMFKCYLNDITNCFKINLEWRGRSMYYPYNGNHRLCFTCIERNCCLINEEQGTDVLRGKRCTTRAWLQSTKVLLCAMSWTDEQQ